MSEAITNLDPRDYDHIIVGFSGGKDSLACVLTLLRQYPELKDRMELWHHDIDGREGSELMDWAITADYCRAVAEALELPIYYQWRVGGFEGEMLKENARSQGIKYELRDGSGEIVHLETTDAASIATRRKFPQVSADLRVRWCSSNLKIDVCRRVVNNIEEFQTNETEIVRTPMIDKETGEQAVWKRGPNKGELRWKESKRYINPKKILIVTGERAEESTSRSNYNTAEVVKETARTIVHQYRVVHSWTEEQVWDIIKDFRINPHPCYHLGWGRASCLACIFGNKDQWASVRALDPQRFNKIADYETEFGCTIQRKQSVVEQADAGAVYEQITSEAHQREIALSKHYPRDEVIVEDWKLPAGAYRECGGPV